MYKQRNLKKNYQNLGQELLDFKKDFEATIEQEVDWEIPNDPKLMIQVAKSGKILSQSAKHSKISKQIHTICDSLTGSAEESDKGGFLKKIGLG